MAIPTRSTPTAALPTSVTGTHDKLVGVENTSNDWLSPAARRVMAVLRIMFGFTFLWAFFDKLFGLGFSTPVERAWVNGGDPTMGFLSKSDGTFGPAFQSLAGQFWVSPLFMLGLLGIGLALIFGVGLRVAAVAGALMYGFMYLASLPLVTNPVIDDHLSGAVTLVLFALAYAGDTWGFGNWWKNTTITKRFPALR
jgi:thiosulfate dehydrogenase [quinone] large subunit